MTVRVFVVDDHPLFRVGVRAALEAFDLDLAGEAATGDEAVRLLRQLDPAVDVVLMDAHLPDGSGVTATRMITSEVTFPEGAPRVLMMSTSDRNESVVAALQAGAHGYVAKNTSLEELIRAILTVADGGAVFGPAIAGRLGSYFTAVHQTPGQVAFPELTNRELQILRLLARGYENRRIARELVIADKTVRNYVSALFTKLRVSTRGEAMVRARDAGLG
ncbi:response regulator transcription factor [Micromonospora sp. NPDC005215]|uniref:response regulator transcription factor n=1 Tax=Micromonospora sp. NPDC005215 TaxID=3157024 RepID=UPI0033BB18A4